MLGKAGVLVDHAVVTQPLRLPVVASIAEVAGGSGRTGVGFYSVCALFILVMAFVGWIGWLATARAWDQIEANRGIHGTYRPASCRVDTFTTQVNATRRHPGGETVSNKYTCQGTFTSDNGGSQTQVFYTGSVAPTIGKPFRAVIASSRSSNAYAEGGSPAGYVMIALACLCFPVGVVIFAVRERRGKANRRRRRRNLLRDGG